jgi:polar amino acid transport system substrate-binding protein
LLRWGFYLRSVFLFTLFYSHTSLASELLRFSTLDWPPYSGENLPGKGLTAEIISAAFKAEGYLNIQFDFLPWSRALSVAEKDERYIGCLNAYYSKERAKKFIISDPVISSLIKFAERRDNPIKWNHLEDLRGKKIGVVQDYVNTSELEQLFTNKTLYADIAIDDSSNLTKIAYRRVDLAIIDSNVFEYLMNTHLHFKTLKNELILGPKILEEKKLFVLFSKNLKGKKYAQIFNRGLKKINITKLAMDYMDKIKK